MNEENKTQEIVVVDVTKRVGEILEAKGFGSDANSESDISKAGIFDLCDATSGTDNSKFTKEDALAEMQRRGL